MENISLSILDGLFRENCSNIYSNKTSFYEDNNFLFCETIFDGVQCWPPTPAGTVVAMACPKNFGGYEFNSNVNATRVCSVDGIWAENRTNYDSCPKTRQGMINLLGLYIAGYALSIICLCSALFIFCHFKGLKCTRNFIHCHLFSSLLLRSVSFLALFIAESRVRFSASSIPFRVITMISKLAHLAIFHWMLIEGLYLFKLIYWTYGLRRLRTRHFAIIGWGIPCFLTMLNTLWNVLTIPQELWIEKLDYFTDIPIIIILIMNSIIMLFIIHALVVKLRARRPLMNRKSGKQFEPTRSDSSGFNKTHRMSYQLSRFPIEYRKAMKATLVLMPLLGFYYIIFITHYHVKMEVMFKYLNAILTSTQGFWVALIYCFLNIEVRKLVRARLTAWREGYNQNLLSHLGRILLLIFCCLDQEPLVNTNNGQRARSIYHCQVQNQPYVQKSSKKTVNVMLQDVSNQVTDMPVMSLENKESL